MRGEKTIIRVSPDYQYGTTLAEMFGRYMEPGAGENSLIINLPPRQVREMLGSVHPGLAEDIQDLSISIEPFVPAGPES